MKIDEQLSELKSAWRETPGPDPDDLARRVRRSRLRGRLAVALEVALTIVGVIVGVIVIGRDGWFATVIGLAVIAFSVWALHVSLAIRRRGRGAETDSVRGRVEQLCLNATTNLGLVRAGYRACVLAVGFVALVYLGSALDLPGAPSDMGWSTVFAIAYVGVFAGVSRLYARRVERELNRLREIEAGLDET